MNHHLTDHARQIIDGLQEQIRQLEASIAYQNKVNDAYRHEAQEARASERKAWAKADELAKALGASQGALSECEAARATLESRLK